MNMLIHITNREPLMRLDIYNMMDGLTQDWRQNAAHRDALALMTAIAMASLPGIEEHVPEGEGIRQGYLVELLGMIPNGVRGSNVIRAAKIRFQRAYRRLRPEIIHLLGDQAFYPVFGHGDRRLHRMMGPLCQYIDDWAAQSEDFRAWYNDYYGHPMFEEE